MSVKRNPKISALVVNAIRRLQDVHGSTSKEIGNYIAKEYNVPGQDIRRQVQVAIRRAVSYGILQRTKGGYYVCSNPGTKSETGELMICTPRKLLCRSKSRKSRKKSCSRRARSRKKRRGCKKKSKRRSSCRKKSGKKRRRHGMKRKCGHRRKSRRKSRSRRCRSKKRSKRSCGGRSRSRRRKSRSRSRRGCAKKPRKCSDLNLGAKTGNSNNTAKSNNASISGSRPNSPSGSTVSRSSDERIE